MGRKLKILLSIPRTIWFNFRYLPLHQALKLPIWIANNVRIKELHRGCLNLRGRLRVALIRIGYHEAEGDDAYSVHTIISITKSGRLVTKKDVHIGQGASIRINNGGIMVLGANFAISGTTTIIASKLIEFGSDVQLSRKSLIMDYDGHKIFDEGGHWINPPESIKIGSNVWIGDNVSILKGSVIPDNTIVAANSLVNKPFSESSTIIGGQPAKVLKKFGHFTI